MRSIYSIKNSVTLSILLSLAPVATCLAGSEKPADKWFQCVANTDCVHIEYACAQGVVNKAFAKDANDYFALENARRNCVRPADDAHKNKEPYKVYCEINRCKVKGVNPKPPGFS